MTRASHYVIGLASAAALAGSLPSPMSLLIAAGIVAGANLPDDLELPRRPNAWGQMRPPVIPHRTITHWPWTYGIAMVVLALFRGSPIALVGLGVALGSLIHLLCDSVSPHGIPWLTPFRSVAPPASFVVYSTRKANELLLVFPMVIVAMIALWHGWPMLTASGQAAFVALGHELFGRFGFPT